jgi:6-phosphogluconolactonase
MSMPPLWNTDIRVSASEAEAAVDCAAYIGDELAEALRIKGSAIFAVSGGNSPRVVFGHLARRKLAWSRVHIFWVDERCVPPDDPASNYRMAMESLITPAGISAANVHRVLTELGPEKAAQAYEEEIERVCGDGLLKRFDVMHRGIGPDAHTASLFPGDPLVLKPDGTAVAVYVAKFQQWRVTMTPATLTEARTTAIFAPGADKAEAVARILEGPDDPLSTPAQIASRGGVVETWFLDQASAAQLTPDSLPIEKNQT